MTDINLLQKGDLASSDFSNNNSNAAGGVRVRVSAVGDNLLQQKDDGLYYGITPPANVANLYVDAVNGTDQDPNVVAGAGTRTSPLKTFTYACQLAVNGTHRRIYLMADQDHIVDSAASATVKAGELTVFNYGPVYDNYLATHKASAVVSINLRNDNKAARLVLRGFETYKWYGDDATDVVDLVSIENNGNLRLECISIVFDNQGEINPTKAGITTLRAYSTARILNKGTLNLSISRVSSRGTTTVNSAFVSGIKTQFNDKGIIPAKGKHFVGLVATISPYEAVTSVYNVLYESENMFTSFRAWGTDYAGVISLKDSGLSNNHVVTDNVYTKVFDDIMGAKVLLSPRSDVKSSDWY